MSSIVDEVLAAMKKFDAENENIDTGPTGSWGGPHGSKNECEKAFRESMSALAKIWKKKAAELAGKGNKNAQYEAALALVTPYRNVQTTYQNCLKEPLHPVKTPKPGDNITGIQ